VQPKTQARAHARALVGAVAIGSTLSLALGGAYLAGGASRALAATSAEQVAAAGTAVMTPAGNMTPTAEGKAPSVADVAGQAAKSAFDIGPAAQPFAGASGRDLDCLTTAVYYEARGEGAAGQAAVAQVVLNRVRHPAFPKTVCGVVFQGSRGHGCQFSFACNGAMHARKNGAAWSRAHEIASRAMSGFVLSGVGNATHFHATRVAPGWRGMVRVAQVGAHVFYRFGGRAGAPGVFKASHVRMASAEASRPAYKLLRPSSLEGGELTLASAETTSDAAASAPLAAAASPAETPAAKSGDAAKPAALPEAKPAAAVQATSATAS
jgi:spore germination cell wall hydrolase CwlJ-like protein